MQHPQPQPQPYPHAHAQPHPAQPHAGVAPPSVGPTVQPPQAQTGYVLAPEYKRVVGNLGTRLSGLAVVCVALGVASLSNALLNFFSSRGGLPLMALIDRLLWVAVAGITGVVLLRASARVRAVAAPNGDTPLMAALDAMSNAFLVPLVAAGAALVLGILIPG